MPSDAGDSRTAHRDSRAAPVARERLARRIDPATTALLTVECQQGVVGPGSALPELAAEARSSGALAAVARLVAAAHTAGVQVLHAVAERRPDGRGTGRNAPLLRAAERLPVRQYSGTAAVRIAPPIEPAAGDIVVRRLHGLTPLAGTGVDGMLRHLGCRTLLIAGVSANVAVPNAVFDAVNLGYTAVVASDAVAGVPADYTPAMIRHTLALVATIATSDEIIACWAAGSGSRDDMQADDTSAGSGSADDTSTDGMSADGTAPGGPATPV
ncbi:isochorismatase family protein [Streptomyces clavuligerus]|uniref:Isochorismatase hydrolase n=1 Tax=Streptomyces clavuligerus TaxID=1901 RepID=E2PU49_STRCL|nr:isochorismatase family protein [Streptomyces clavuligerus]ANW22092.1 isochorismatase [Streptomyces clavuligerus]AXU16726.1 isochorismatase family protein [Streptomyces clavuligerus]EFG05668.1 Isochorismatase hydrolase [Streptomyces clavuligerus]MBY6305970.1 isochorismatase family protein [Streptomyces clavuligerus]QCS09488.1 isochorismatase [Streptomyces clavuligerus]